MNVLSFDPGLRKIGVYAKIGSLDRTDLLLIPAKVPRLDALDKIYRFVLAYIRKAQRVRLIHVGIVEGYAFSKHSSSTTTMAEVGGIIRVLLTMHKIPVIELSPIVWKSIILGKAGIRMKKGTVPQCSAYLAKAESIFKRRFSSTDEADAFMMAECLQRIYLGEVYEGEGVRKIKAQLYNILTTDRVMREGALFK